MDEREEAAAAAVKRGYELFRAHDDVPGAIRVFQQVLAALPGWKDAYVGWEQAAYADPAERLRATRARLEGLPAEPEEDLGWWLERLLMWQPPDLVVTGLVLERMGALYPESPILRFQRARWHMWSGDPDRACDELYEVVACQPQCDGAWLRSELEAYVEFDALPADRLTALIARIDALGR